MPKSPRKILPIARSTKMISVGSRFGIVILKMRWKMFAPSISAASYISVSMLVMAARYIIVP
ncbi:hypothetical protein D3C80_2130990 [compost metagenome]